MKTLNVIFLGAVLVLFGACAAGTLEQGEELRLKPLVDRICDRHDEFVDADGTAGEAQKSQWRRQSASFRAAFVVPTVQVSSFVSDAREVLTRHDAYVEASDMSQASKRMALLSSANIRRTLDEASKRNE